MGNNHALKSFFRYVSLNVLGMIGLSCYILADTFFVSNALGTNGLAALNFSISIYSLIHGTGLMLGIGGASQYAVLKARGENKKANIVFSMSIKSGLIIGVILALIGVFFNNQLARLLGAGTNTLGFTRTYLTTILCFAPCFITNNILLAFIRNDNNPRLSMIAMLTGSFSNVILDYIFVFPLSMGMFGAALATGIAPIISIGVLSFHFIKGKNQFMYLRNKLKITAMLKNMNSGLSAFTTEISSAIVLITFNLVILNLEGDTGVAAYGVVANLSLVAISVFTGIAQGMQPLVSKGYGLHDHTLLKQVLRYAKITAVAAALIIYAVTICCSDFIISVFNSEKNNSLQLLASEGFRIYFIGFIFVGINIITAAFLSAVEKAKNAFIISIMRGCVVIVPAVMILSKAFGMSGVWWSFVVTELIVTITAAVILRQEKK